MLVLSSAIREGFPGEVAFELSLSSSGELPGMEAS